MNVVPAKVQLGFIKAEPRKAFDFIRSWHFDASAHKKSGPDESGPKSTVEVEETLSGQAPFETEYGERNAAPQVEKRISIDIRSEKTVESYFETMG